MLAEGFMDTCRELGGPHHELEELSLTMVADNRWCSPAAAALQHQVPPRRTGRTSALHAFVISPPQTTVYHTYIVNDAHFTLSTRAFTG